MPITEIDRATGLAASAAYKAPCLVATAGNIVLAAEQVIDGILTAESRVLVRAQADPAENGIYISSSGFWQRAPDFSRNEQVRKGTGVFVTDGDEADLWVVQSDDPIDLDTTAIVWSATAFSKADAVVDMALAAAAAAQAAAAAAAASAGSLTPAAQQVTDAAAKEAPTDADLLLTVEAPGSVAKKTTFAQLATWIGGKLGAIVAALAAKATPVDGDALALADSAAGNASKRLSWASLKATLKAYFDDLYMGKTASVGWDMTGQSWQNVRTLRTSNTSYQNTTGKPIVVVVHLQSGTSGSGSKVEVSNNNSTWLNVGGSIFPSSFPASGNPDDTEANTTTVIVPPNGYYRFGFSSTNATFFHELR